MCGAQGEFWASFRVGVDGIRGRGEASVGFVRVAGDVNSVGVGPVADEGVEAAVAMVLT